MATTMVNIRMDEDVKRDMEAVCKELGMNMTTAFTIFAKKMGREHRIPFDVSVDPFYSDENLAHIRRGVASLNEGHGITEGDTRTGVVSPFEIPKHSSHGADCNK